MRAPRKEQRPPRDESGHGKDHPGESTLALHEEPTDAADEDGHQEIEKQRTRNERSRDRRAQRDRSERAARAPPRGPGPAGQSHHRMQNERRRGSEDQRAKSAFTQSHVADCPEHVHDAGCDAPAAIDEIRHEVVRAFEREYAESQDQ